ncbi:MAG: helix-turn-helix transcriptional regulator [Oscillospiraceae bacterium]
MASVGTHIKRLRAARGLTQEALAERLFVTRQAVSAWETGKALPDVDTLQRIAAALDADVTELIYGVPQPPELRRVKRRWALTGGGIAIIIAVLLIILLRNGAYGTWRDGLAFQLHDANYGVAYQDVPGGWSLELDLTDLESNVGKLLYEDESGCRIEVSQVDTNGTDGSEYRVWFRAYGVYDRGGGELVSGCQSTPVDKTAHTLSTSASMTATVDGAPYPCTEAGASGLIYKDGNMFGFYLNPRTPQDFQKISVEGLDRITVTVSGLTRFSAHRISYWDLY